MLSGTPSGEDIRKDALKVNNAPGEREFNPFGIFDRFDNMGTFFKNFPDRMGVWGSKTTDDWENRLTPFETDNIEYNRKQPEFKRIRNYCAMTFPAATKEDAALRTQCRIEAGKTCTSSAFAMCHDEVTRYQHANECGRIMNALPRCVEKIALDVSSNAARE